MKINQFIFFLAIGGCIFFTDNLLACYGELAQEDFQKIIFKIQSTQNEKQEIGKIFQQFVPNETQILRGLDFNIKNLTTVSKSEPITRPGLAPEWGTDIFEKMHFENLIFRNCNFQWLNLSKATFKNVKFIDCNFEWTVCDETTFENVVFEDCMLNQSTFFKSKFNDVMFSRNEAHYVNFMEADLEKVFFHLNDLKGSNFFGVTSKNILFKGMTRDVLLYDIAREVELNQALEDGINEPIILMAWDNKTPALSHYRLVKKIQELGGIPFKYNYRDSGIDDVKLSSEVERILEDIDPNSPSPLPKRILERAKEGDFPELSKILTKTQAWVKSVSGILFPGGQDIRPFFYGQDPHPKTSKINDLRRDLFEFAILDALEETDLPFMGVCRGLQVFNVWRGGTLHQHVEGHLYFPQNYHLVSKEDGILSEIFKNSVNPFTGFSFHHQAVDKVGQGLKVIARSNDETIKAMEIAQKRFGVLLQWHPEFKGDVSTPAAEQLDAKLSIGNHEILEQFIKASQK